MFRNVTSSFSTHHSSLSPISIFDIHDVKMGKTLLRCTANTAKGYRFYKLAFWVIFVVGNQKYMSHYGQQE